MMSHLENQFDWQIKHVQPLLLLGLGSIKGYKPVAGSEKASSMSGSAAVSWWWSLAKKGHVVLLNLERGAKQPSAAIDARQFNLDPKPLTALFPALRYSRFKDYTR